MRFLYTLLLYLLLPIVCLRLIWRGFGNPDYWSRWSERFGFIRAPDLRSPIWLHAVSVGEVRAALPVVHYLLEHYPRRSVVLTTTTPTGSEQVRSLLGDQVYHVYLPYDLPGSVSRFLKRVKPTFAVVMETELWPNLFSACVSKKIPVVLANARLSKKSAEGYRRFDSLVKQTLRCLDFVAVQSVDDEQRFLDLGARKNKIVRMGNLKFDYPLPDKWQEKVNLLRSELGEHRPIWVAASTHEGEEEHVLKAFRLIQDEIKDCLLVLVPRHPERFSKVAKLCETQGFQVARRSKKEKCETKVDIYLADSMGELQLFYGAVDVAFVGGSLVPTGGHNMLEPASMGVPVITGPYLENFKEIGGMLLSVNAAKQIRNSEELASQVVKLLQDKLLRAQVGEQGQKIVKDNRGALERLMKILRPYLV